MGGQSSDLEFEDLVMCPPYLNLQNNVLKFILFYLRVNFDVELMSCVCCQKLLYTRHLLMAFKCDLYYMIWT